MSDRSRRTYAAADARRARILDTAVEHFASSGFAGSSLMKIAKDVGISQAGLQHHFPTKADLLVACLGRLDEEDNRKFLAEAPATMATFFDRLVSMAAANAERPGRTQMNNVLVAEAADSSHPAHVYFRDRYERVISGCERIGKNAVMAGELRPDTDIHEVAVTIAAVMDGLQLQWGLAPDTFDMPGHLRRILDAMYAGIKA